MRVKVAFLDADEKILPDLSARVAFTSEATQGQASRSRVLVPRSAVASMDGKTGVFRIVEGRAVFVPIEAGGEVQGQVEVKSGLQGGEQLISTPAGLRDGERVRIEGEKD